MDAGTEEAQRNTVDRKIIDKMVDMLNRRNYIRNLVRDVKRQWKTRSEVGGQIAEVKAHGFSPLQSDLKTSAIFYGN